MAEGYWKSSRIAKSKREAGFVYEDDNLEGGEETELHHSISSVPQHDSVKVWRDIIYGKDTPISPDFDSNNLAWSDIYRVPILTNDINDKLIVNEVELSAEGSPSQSQFERSIDQLAGFVDSGSGTDSGAVCHHNASNRWEFGFKEPFLSVSSELHTDTSDLHSDMEQLCVCNSGTAAKDCCGSSASIPSASGGGGEDAKAIKALWAAVGKMELISKEVKGLKQQMNEQN